MTLPEWNLVAPPEQRPMQPRWGLLSVTCRTMHHSFHRIRLASATPLRCQATPYFGWDSRLERGTLHALNHSFMRGSGTSCPIIASSYDGLHSANQHNQRPTQRSDRSYMQSKRHATRLQCNNSSNQAASRAEGRARYQPGLASPRQ